MLRCMCASTDAVGDPANNVFASLTRYLALPPLLLHSFPLRHDSTTNWSPISRSRVSTASSTLTRNRSDPDLTP